MSIFHDSALIGSGGGAAAYQINQSLRFVAGNDYLTRTPASNSNRTTWTWSGWVKYPISSGNHAVLFSAGNYDRLRITTSGHTPSNALDWYANVGGYLESSNKLRDPSAWYHIVLIWDTTNGTAADRARYYINGERVTSFYASSNPASSAQSLVNSTAQHNIGRLTSSSPSSENMEGYLAEVNFIDGTALTPSSFGETDTITGAWIPKRYSGSYGTNGFYLKFDPSATNGIGHDHSGNGNNWTASGFVTSGTGTDVMSDTPTNNYATGSPLLGFYGSGSTDNKYSDGNLAFSLDGSERRQLWTHAFPPGGRYYCELTYGGNNANMGFNLTNGPWWLMNNSSVPEDYISLSKDANNTTRTIDGWAGNYVLTQVTSQGGSPTIGMAVDTRSWPQFTVQFYAGGSALGSSFTKTFTRGHALMPGQGGINSGTSYLNAGQRPFANTPPSGYEPLCTASFPAANIAKPGSHFKTVIYTGTGSSRSVSGVGFQPDMVWIKKRSGANSHSLFDVIRGANKNLSPNQTIAEVTNNSNGYLTSYDSDGFTIATGGGDVNGINDTYVAWCWKRSPASGFDILTYTGNGASNRAIPHNLGTTPAFAIVKMRSASQSWWTWHQSFGNNLGGTNKMMELNSGGTQYTDDVFMGFDSSNVYIGTDFGSNQSGQTYVMYVWSEVPGFSSFTTYRPNGNTNGPFIYTGFRPAWILIKNTSSQNWFMFDGVRTAYNPAKGPLKADSSESESFVDNYEIDLLSNGFKLRNASGPLNYSGTTMVAAFADLPFKYANAR